MAVQNFTANMLESKGSEIIPSGVYHSICIGIITLFIVTLWFFMSRQQNFPVPLTEPAGFFALYFGSLKFILKAREMLEVGHAKYKQRSFMVPEFGKWRIVINDPQLIHEVQRIPSHTMSFVESMKDTIAAEYTLGPLIANNQYYVDVIRGNFTRNISDFFPDLMEEITMAIDENISPGVKEWKPLVGLEVMTRIICRATNRVLVGPSICRNEDYMDLATRFTEDVMKAAHIINIFPKFTRKFVGAMLATVSNSTQRGMGHLKPEIEYRLRQYEEHGKDWPGKSSDMLTWLMDEASGELRTVKALTQCILALNFAAIHTTSMSLTQALFHLATYPDDILPLQEEIKLVIETDGWSKGGISKMHKLDSFMKETQRFYGIGLFSVSRKVLSDYTLSDGTFLPAGSLLACNAYAIHRDENFYEDPFSFDGLRFLRHTDKASEAQRNQMTAATSDFMSFSLGRHACPGRFFAAIEMKAAMAYLLMNYDIKMENGVYPKNLEFGSAIVPNPKARVLFRRR